MFHPVFRPWHLPPVAWALLALNALAALDAAMVWLRDPAYLSQVSGTQLAALYAMPDWVRIAWAGAAACGLAGALLLMLRRWLALWAFILSAMGTVLLAVWHLALTPVPGGGPGTGRIAVALAVTVAEVAYTRRLKQRGALGAP